MQRPNPLIYSILLIAILFMILPLFIQPEVYSRLPNRLGRSKWQVEPDKRMDQPTIKLNKQEKKVANKQYHQSETSPHQNQYLRKVEIYGKQTLKAACMQIQISPEVVCQKLNIPETQKNERLGNIKRHYNLSMSKIRQTMLEIQNTNKSDN